MKKIDSNFSSPKKDIKEDIQDPKFKHPNTPINKIKHLKDKTNENSVINGFALGIVMPYAAKINGFGLGLGLGGGQLNGISFGIFGKVRIIFDDGIIARESLGLQRQ